MGLHQKSFQPTRPSTSGRRSGAIPNTWGMRSSARTAPKGPMKLRAGPSAPALKNGAGSRGANVARAMSSIRASARAASRRISAPRREPVSGVAIAVLDLHHYRNDHGPVLGPPPEEASELVLD